MKPTSSSASPPALRGLGFSSCIRLAAVAPRRGRRRSPAMTPRASGRHSLSSGITLASPRRHSLSSGIALASVLAASPLFAQASPDSFRLRQIVVTATKVPTPQAAVPAHVTVLHGAALRAAGYVRLVDALRDQAGIAVAQLGSPGAVASLFLRGGESDYVQVLVDGVQVNDPGGAYDWAHLTTADVERIEIVRGPASVLYGSDAISGVVQVFTRGSSTRIGADAGGGGTPIGGDAGAGSGPRIEADAGAGSAARVGEHATGSFRTWHASAAVSGGGDVAWGTAGYAFTAARQHSDGAYAFNNQYGNTTLAGRLTLERGSGSRLAASARYTDQRFHYPTDGAGNVVDRNRATFGESLAAGAVLQQPLAPAFTAQLALGLFRGDTGADDPEDEPGQGFSRSTGEVARDQLELRLDGRPTPALALSAGMELERQHGRSTFDSDGPFGPYSSASDNERSNRAVFAQLVHAGRSLGLTAGGRLDHSTQFGGFATARVGVSWQLARALRIHTAWGSGFKEPTFLETYATGFARGNPSLEPERARSVELGVRADGGRAHVAVTAFRQSFRNLIQYTFAPPDEAAPNYFNMGEARAFGLELEAGASLPHGLHASAGYTGLDTEVVDAGFGEDRQFLEGKSLLRRPGRQLSGTVGWSARRVSASLRGELTGARADLDFTDPAEWQGRRVELEAYTTVAASLAYHLPLRRGHVESTLRIRNLFDERYQEVFNFPAPGRMIDVGVMVVR